MLCFLRSYRQKNCGSGQSSTKPFSETDELVTRGGENVFLLYKSFPIFVWMFCEQSTQLYFILAAVEFLENTFNNAVIM